MAVFEFFHGGMKLLSIFIEFYSDYALYGREGENYLFEPSCSMSLIFIVWIYFGTIEFSIAMSFLCESLSMDILNVIPQCSLQPISCPWYFHLWSLLFLQMSMDYLDIRSCGDIWVPFSQICTDDSTIRYPLAVYLHRLNCLCCEIYDEWKKFHCWHQNMMDNESFDPSTRFNYGCIPLLHFEQSLYPWYSEYIYAVQLFPWIHQRHLFLRMV